MVLTRLDKIANDDNSGNDENDKAAEDSKKVADEKSGGEDEEEKLRKLKTQTTQMMETILVFLVGAAPRVMEMLN